MTPKRPLACSLLFLAGAAAAAPPCDLHFYSSEGEIQRPFRRLTSRRFVFNYNKPPDKIVKAVRAWACKLGADAVVLPELSQTPQRVSPPAVAIRYVDFVPADRMKAGFRDLHWGDRVPENMSCQAAGGDTQNCRRSADSLVLGTIPLAGIEYVFLHGQLAEVRVTVAAGAFDEVRDFLAHQWGEPSRDESARLVWQLEDGSTEAALSRYMDNSRVELQIYSPKALKGSESKTGL